MSVEEPGEGGPSPAEEVESMASGKVTAGPDRVDIRNSFPTTAVVQGRHPHPHTATKQRQSVPRETYTLCSLSLTALLQPQEQAMTRGPA